MALVEIDDIELGAPHPGKIQAFSIDAPCIGGRNVYDVEFAGWVLESASQSRRSKFTRVVSSFARHPSISSDLTSLATTPILRVQERVAFAPA